MCKLIWSNCNNVTAQNAKSNCKQRRDNNNRSRLIQFEWKAWLNAISITLMLTVWLALGGPGSALVFSYLRPRNSLVMHRQWNSNNCFSQLQISDSNMQDDCGRKGSMIRGGERCLKVHPIRFCWMPCLLWLQTPNKSKQKRGKYENVCNVIKKVKQASLHRVFQIVLVSCGLFIIFKYYYYLIWLTWLMAGLDQGFTSGLNQVNVKFF